MSYQEYIRTHDISLLSVTLRDSISGERLNAQSMDDLRAILSGTVDAIEKTENGTDVYIAF